MPQNLKRDFNIEIYEEEDFKEGDQKLLNWEFKDLKFQIRICKLSPHLTDRYEKFSEILDQLKILPMDVCQALEELFSRVPKFALKEVQEIIQYTEDHIVAIRVNRASDLFYNNSWDASLVSGWYYYITGAKMPTPPIIKTMNDKIRLTGMRKKKQNDRPFLPPKLIDEKIALEDVTLKTLIDRPDEHCYEMKIKDKTIWFDCGFGENRCQLKPTKSSNTSEEEPFLALSQHLQATKPNWVIITHFHKDHFRGLEWTLREKYPSLLGILCTKTTFYLLASELNKSPQHQLLLDRFAALSYIIPYDTGIDISRNAKLTFLPAGHFPGNAACFFRMHSLSTQKDQSEWTLFYSGDFYFNNISPIPGLEAKINRLPKNINLGLLDGSNRNNNNPSLEEQLDVMYQHACLTWEDGGSVLIATDRYVGGVTIYRYFFERDLAAHAHRNFYLSEKLMETIRIFAEAKEDFTPEDRQRVQGQSNPFESWRMNVLKNTHDTFEALASPSLILTYPTEINMKPFSEIFPLVAMEKHNLIIFASFYTEDETYEFVKDQNPFDQKMKTTLNGILTEPLDVTFKPLCKVLNRDNAFRNFRFQNHADKGQIANLDAHCTFQEKIWVHYKKETIMSELWPKNG